MLKGWIKIHRKLKNHFVYKDSEMLHIWLNILLNASHKYHEVFINGNVVELYPGQVIYGRKEWSKTLGITESKLRTRIDTLINTGMISRFTTTRYSILTVKNWCDYQDFYEKTESFNHQCSQNDNQVNSQSKESELNDLDENSNQANNHTDNQQDATNKNVKNDKNNIYEFWNEKGIIVHRKLTKKMDTKIRSTLKDYSLEEIKQSISNYAEIVLSDKYYFSHKWTLDEFLQRGIAKFANREVAVANYISKNINESPQGSKTENWRGTDRRF